MTLTQQVEQPFSWSRQERRSISQFGDGSNPNAISNALDNLLAECRFAPYADVSLLDSSAFYMDLDRAKEPITPRFSLVVPDSNLVFGSLKVNPADLELCLSVRSQHLRRYEVLKRWPIAKMPSETWTLDPQMLSGLQTGRGMDFILSIRFIADCQDQKSLGLYQGKILCRKVFSVKEDVNTFTFPFKWAEFGGDTNYPEEALWIIEWKPEVEVEDICSRPVGEALIVLGNEKAQEPIEAMAAVPGSNDMGWKMMASDITTQIFADVLCRTDPLPDEDDIESLSGQVFTRLRSVTGKNYIEIKELASLDDSLTELRSAVSVILKLVQ